MIQARRTKGEIFVMDSDAATRETLSMILRQEGYQVICFADGAALLSLAKARIPACIFLEVTIPRKSGIDTLKRLRAQNNQVPVFAISGRADIPTAVDAIRSGAIDFIQKPFLSNEIIGRVNEAVDTPPPSPDEEASSRIRALSLPGSTALTLREREVLAQIAAGATNKEAARELGLSSRTIEDHRASIMKKIGAKNAAELMRRVFGEQRSSTLIDH
jgi:FixJ family two-component response regulator